jgi:hypothetical protein
MSNKKLRKDEDREDFLFPEEELKEDDLDDDDLDEDLDDDDLDEALDDDDLDELFDDDDEDNLVFLEDEVIPEEMRLEESLDLIRFEHIEEKLEGQDEDLEAELDTDYDNVYKTKHSDGHTNNIHVAWDQGLTYTPPDDPATIPSDKSTWGLELAAGFSSSVEEAGIETEDLPENVDNNDLDLLDDINIALHNNSETGHLTNIKVQVEDGVVNLWGTVPTEDDIAIISEVIGDLEGVVEIIDNLEVED